MKLWCSLLLSLLVCLLGLSYLRISILANDEGVLKILVILLGEGNLVLGGLDQG